MVVDQIHVHTSLDFLDVPENSQAHYWRAAPVAVLRLDPMTQHCARGSILQGHRLSAITSVYARRHWKMRKHHGRLVVRRQAGLLPISPSFHTHDARA